MANHGWLDRVQHIKLRVKVVLKQQLICPASLVACSVIHGLVIVDRDCVNVVNWADEVIEVMVSQAPFNQLTWLWSDPVTFEAYGQLDLFTILLSETACFGEECSLILEMLLEAPPMVFFFGVEINLVSRHMLTKAKYPQLFGDCGRDYFLQRVDSMTRAKLPGMTVMGERHILELGFECDLSDKRYGAEVSALKWELLAGVLQYALDIEWQGSHSQQL
jgi:hypothetical protein